MQHSELRQQVSTTALAARTLAGKNAQAGKNDGGADTSKMPPSATQGVICFDDESRVIIVSSQAEKLSAEVFDCTAQVGKPLPAPLLQCIAELREIPASTGDGTLRRDFRNKGKCINISLALDPQGNNHCLILERIKEVTDPSQLKPLRLSPRETLVTFWIMHQKTNWEIGRILQISTRTVDKHVEKIFLKQGVNDRRDLVLRAREICDT